MEPNVNLNERKSGIVMPIFSLPGPYGIGTLGEGAYKFVDWLVKAKQTYWQILPTGQTGYGNSPYQTYSVVAGNPYFIDLDKVADMGLLVKDCLQQYRVKESLPVDYDRINEIQFKLLEEAFHNVNGNPEIALDLCDFEKENKDWLEDYAMFMALKKEYKQKPVWEWAEAIKKRNPQDMRYYSAMLKEEIDFYKFIQYLFFKQYKELKQYANSRGVFIIGDIPIYPSPDSCDIWANPDLFKLDQDLKPAAIAGVPPDYYSETGQLWGNPVYNWDVLKSKKYDWWIWRLKHMLEISDVIRIDHFRAFQDYWEVPAGEETAINGKWQPGPRMDFFDQIKEQIGNIPIIAEDLGIIGDDVRELLAKTGYPGMRVLIFGLKADEDNLHLPHNWPKNCVGYTSTHDSATIWEAIVEAPTSKQDSEFATAYFNAGPQEELGISAIRSAMASPANTVMLMISDLMSLGREGRINVPATVSKENWSCRVASDQLTDELAEKLAFLTKTYKRGT